MASLKIPNRAHISTPEIHTSVSLCFSGPFLNWRQLPEGAENPQPSCYKSLMSATLPSSILDGLGNSLTKKENTSSSPHWRCASYFLSQSSPGLHHLQIARKCPQVTWRDTEAALPCSVHTEKSITPLQTVTIGAMVQYYLSGEWPYVHTTYVAYGWASWNPSVAQTMLSLCIVIWKETGILQNFAVRIFI